ncbi:MAG: T9SS type A sorting domain-containing protein [Paludibacteraceae bacterium]|nr:T9SS type A sorting domain-containing protein [Paludibacteraceae bacterium]
MKKNNFVRLLTTLWLCVAIGVAAQAQSVKITPSGSSSGYYCMPADNTGTSFSVAGVNLSTDPNVTATIESTAWTVFGGIQKLSASGTNISVASGTGTDYTSLYSKYAKGKIRAVCHVKYSYTYNTSDCYQNPGTATYIYYADYTTELEIRKTFSIPDGSLTNPIVGPECVVAGENVTYSVAPWVSLDDVSNVVFDTYTWNVPSSAKINDLYYSSDKSSITFKPSATAGGQTITVDLGACNSTGAQSSITLKSEPDAPYLVGNTQWVDNLCIPLSASTYELTIANPQSGVTYTWEKLSGWYSTDQYVVESDNKIVLSPKDDNKYIRLRAKSSCTEKIYDLQINRSFDPVVNTITTAYADCLPENTDVTFSVNGASKGIPMGWTISPEGITNGWSIANDQKDLPTPIIHTGTGVATVYATASCGVAIPQLCKVKPNVPIINEGKKCLAFEDKTDQVFTTTKDNGATGYQWDFPATWEPLALADRTTTDPTITIKTDGKTAGEIKVKALGCKDSEFSTPVKVGFNPDKPTIEQVGCIDAGLPGVTYFRVKNHVKGQTYTWTIDPAFGAQDMFYNPPVDDSSKIKVNTLGTVDTYNVQATAYNTCGNSGLCDPFSVSVVKEVFTVTASNTGRNQYMYAITEANDDPWYFSHTATWVYNNADATGTDYYKTKTDLPGGLLTSGASNFFVTVTNSAGCKTRMINVPPTFRSAKLLDEADATNSVVDEEMKVSPNPSTGRIKVTLPTDESTNISLYDLKGSLLKTWTNQPAVSILDISDLESSNYFVVAHQNGKRYSKKIILTK